MNILTVHPTLQKFIATRDRRMKHPTTKTPLREAMDELLSRGKIEVGGRASCGGRVDPTWLFYTAWCDIVRKAATLGYRISATPVKHGNGSPTRSGGFWQSDIYEINEAPRDVEAAPCQ